MSDYNECLTTSSGFYSEFGAVRDLLTSADYASRILENSSRLSVESRKKGLEFLSSILVDAIAKCETAAATLEGGEDNE